MGCNDKPGEYEPKTAFFHGISIEDLENPVPDDPVKHPSHYTSQVPGIECKDVIGYFPGHVAAAMKYLWRHQSKVRPIEDLRKAIEFIGFEIERLSREEKRDGSSDSDG